jgi:hypothetical protein
MNKALTILPALTGIVPNEHVEDGRTPTRVAADPIQPASGSIMLNSSTDWRGWQSCGGRVIGPAASALGASAKFD